MKEGFGSLNWCVITDDREKARRLFEEIKAARPEMAIIQEVDSRDELWVRFVDNVHLRWRRASTYSHGCRITRVWIDKNIDPHILQIVIYPMLLCGDEDIVWI